MTADIRTAAQREAEATMTGVIATTRFIEGAVWGAARVTPTREQMVAVLYEAICEFPTRQMDHSRSWAMQEAEEYADAVLAGLAEGES